MRWDADMDKLWTALRLADGGCVAVIGGGGKSTTILALSHVAVRRRLSVIVTTTTKIWPPAGMPLVVNVAGQNLASLVRRELLHTPCVAVGSSITGTGKVVGLEPADVCDLMDSGMADVMLCEADGAAGRSLKVHGPQEPVVPHCASSVAVVAGLDAIGQVPGPDVIHRFEHFLGSFGPDRAQPIDASMVARVLVLAAEKIDPATPVVFVLNKADDIDARWEAGQIRAALAAGVAGSVVVASCHSAFIRREAISGDNGMGGGVLVAP